MAVRIRVLDSANRTMQRLGYLKPLAALVNEIQTTNLASLGTRLIARVAQRTHMAPPFKPDLQVYARTRLTDRTYHDVRKAIMANSAPVSVELQDVYLADVSLPSSTGKLVEANWQRYPYFGTALELVKKGTYSALTRSLVLLAVTPREEISAFKELDREHNPFRISGGQAAVLLYCLLDNDAEVFLPLLRLLVKNREEAFDERFAGDFLPDLLREVVAAHSNRSLPAAERERLSALTKISANIARWKGRPYTGGSARDEAIRVRLEPYCDLGLFSKPAREKYEYRLAKPASVLLEHRDKYADTDAFLQEGFFSAFAQCREIAGTPASDSEAIDALASAGEYLKSSLGYAPITDVGLLAGTRLLVDRARVLELNRTVTLLRNLQKNDPSFVRFTVDRMGSLAHVKFLKHAPGS